MEPILVIVKKDECQVTKAIKTLQLVRTALFTAAAFVWFKGLVDATKKIKNESAQPKAPEQEETESKGE